MLHCRFESLQEPAAARRRALEESRRLHQFLFDVDCELQWIGEKRPQAANAQPPQSLTQALNAHKKHEVRCR